MRYVGLQLTLIVLFSLNNYSGAVIRRVPQDYSTIQAALDAVQAEDTVLVALGTYSEALIAPALPFVLKGDVPPDTGDYPRPVIDPSSLSGSDHLTCLTTRTLQPQIYEDLRFRNGAEMYPRLDDAIGGVHSAGDRVFRHCIFDSAYRSLQSDSGTITLDHCHFVDAQAYAVHSQFGRLTATDCYFSGITVQHFVPLVHTGMRGATFSRCVFGRSFPAETLAALGECSLLDCVFDSCGGPAQVFIPFDLELFRGRIERCAFTHIQTNTHLLNCEAACEDTIVFSDNLISDNTAINGDVGVDFHAPNNDSLDPPDCMYTGIIERNVFCNNVGLDPGIKALHTDPITTLTRNRFVGLLPHDRCCIGYYWSGTDLHENLFEAGDFAILTQDTVRNSDARWNWWGDASGPYNNARNPTGQGAELRGGALFDPWYTDTTFYNSVRGITAPLPDRFTLVAFPNPFNSSVTLTLIPSEIAIVKVELFDILGRRVQQVWSGPLAHKKTITFDGSRLASGIYFVRVWQPIGNRPHALQKLVLLK